MPIATPEVYAEMLGRAKEHQFAFPAINCVGSESINAAIKGFADAGSDGIIQFSTGGRGRSQAERGAALCLKPDMASLATGSVNFPNQIYENHPQLIDDLARTMLDNGIKPEIEIFDLAMLYNARSLFDRGLLLAPVHMQFVKGNTNALPARRRILEYLISELHEVMPGATWTAAGIGRQQLDVNMWALELGGHTRTGLEDSIKFDRTRLASSNAELVARISGLCARYGRRPATPDEARAILSLDKSVPASKAAVRSAL